MLLRITEILLKQLYNKKASFIVFLSTSKSFCSGGDMLELANSQEQKTMFQPWEFTSSEYKLNQIFHRYPKPILSFINGYCIGGGAGICFNSHFSICSNNICFSMPEIKANWIADVGCSFWLQKRCKLYVGEFLTLTGNVLKISDIFYTGLINFCISRNKWKIILSKLEKIIFLFNLRHSITKAILLYNSLLFKKKSILFNDYKIVKQCFSYRKIKDIRQKVEILPKCLFKYGCLDPLNTYSLISLAITLETQRRGNFQSIEQCLQQEYEIGIKFSLKFKIGARRIFKRQLPKYNSDYFHLSDYFRTFFLEIISQIQYSERTEDWNFFYLQFYL